MGFINTGSGYPSDAITVAIAAFLILLTAFIAVTVTVACRYHATKHAYLAAARRWRDVASAAGPCSRCAHHMRARRRDRCLRAPR